MSELGGVAEPTSLRDAIENAVTVLRQWVDWCDYPDGGDIDTNELRNLSEKAARELVVPSPQPAPDSARVTVERDDGTVDTYLVRRSPSCIEQWPDCVDGEYNPSCCRFPKVCSCDYWTLAPDSEKP